MRQKEGIYMTHFYIIRHGETVFNRKGRIQGWCDSPLTDLGVSQAKQLGKELKNVPFDVCFCSTSERAIDTANSILEGRNVKIIPSKNLKEQSFVILRLKNQWIYLKMEYVLWMVIVFVVVKTIVML